MSDADQPWDDGLGDLTAADGPWSLAAAPDDAEFLDFGPLRLPSIAGLKATVEIDPRVRKVGAVSVKVGDCQVQFQVITARSGQSAWSTVRRQLIARLAKRPGIQQTIEGTFGPEVLAHLTGKDRRGVPADVPVRFVGVDGDRWLLRATIMGPSVMAEDTVRRVDALISRVAVERGSDARPAGEVMELAAPPGYLSRDGQSPAGDGE